MFGHAYEGYLRHAYPYDELRPLSCDGVDTWGSYSLTLIDALDTLAVVGNHSEFRRVYQLVTSERVNFDSDINVSVFETNIRIVGGLLGAHLMAKRYLLHIVSLNSLPLKLKTVKFFLDSGQACRQSNSIPYKDFVS